MKLVFPNLCPYYSCATPQFLIVVQQKNRCTTIRNRGVAQLSWAKNLLKINFISEIIFKNSTNKYVLISLGLFQMT